MVAAEACATSTIMRRASMRRTISRPAAVRPPFVDTVGRPAERVVEEVARRHHPVAGVEHDVDVGRVVVERVRALDRQQAGGDRPVGVRRARWASRSAADRDDREPPAGARRPCRRAGGHGERPREQAAATFAAASPRRCRAG